MNNKEHLRTLYDVEASLLRQLQGVRNAIRTVGRRYSDEQGYLVPLTDDNLRKEIRDGQENT